MRFHNPSPDPASGNRNAGLSNIFVFRRRRLFTNRVFSFDLPGFDTDVQRDCLPGSQLLHGTQGENNKGQVKD